VVQAFFPDIAGAKASAHVEKDLEARFAFQPGDKVLPQLAGEPEALRTSGLHGLRTGVRRRFVVLAGMADEDRRRHRRASPASVQPRQRTSS
jgi:hypothetical protein